MELKRIDMAKFALEGEIHHKNDKINLHVDVLIFKEDEVYIAYCAALDLSAFGNTEEEAKKEFETTMTQYFNYCLNKNTLSLDLKRHGWEVKSHRRFRAPTDENMLASNETYRDIRAHKNYKMVEMAIPVI